MRFPRNLVYQVIRKSLIICITIVIFFIILYILGRPVTPWILHGRLGASQCYCNRHLQGIYKGLKLYAERNQGNFPERLEALLEDDYGLLGDPRDPFRCLRCPSHRYDKSRKAEKYKIGYEYIKGRKLGMPFNTVIAFDKAGNHNYKGYEGEYFGRNVLYVDGNIEWFSEEQFQYVLQQIKADLKAKK